MPLALQFYHATFHGSLSQCESPSLGQTASPNPRNFTTKTDWFYLLFIHKGLGVAHKPIFRLNTGWAWAQHTDLYSGSTQVGPGRSMQTYIQSQHRQLLVALCSMQKDLTFFLQPWYTTADDIKRSKTNKQQNAQENHSRYPTGCQPADQCIHPLVAAPRCNGRRTRSAAK